MDEPDPAVPAAGLRPGAGRKRGLTKQRHTRAGPRRGPLTVFVHVPKTAGTTFSAILRMNYPPGAVGNVGNVFKGRGGTDPAKLVRLHASGVTLTRNLQVLSGHLPFGLRKSLPADTRYITFLRDPVERTLSHYYSLLEVRKRDPLPEGATLDEILAEGTYIYDNLQTRMLSDDPSPFGKTTRQMLEQAKANLENAFEAFGLVERFDDSLVLFKRSLGLRSVLYVRQRVTARPRAKEVPDDFVRAAERYNEYDVDLYQHAKELFERTVAEQGPRFALELAALRRALHAGLEDVPTDAPPPESALDREQLWQLAVDSRAELLSRDHDLLTAVEQADTNGDGAAVRGLLEQTNATLSELAARIESLEASVSSGTPMVSAPAQPRRRAAASGPPGDRPKKRRKAAARAAAQAEAAGQSPPAEDEAETAVDSAPPAEGS